MHLTSHPNLIKRSATFAKEVLLETLWPTRCAICDAPGEVICAGCMSALRYVDANRACPTCGAPYGQHQCTECNKTMLDATGLGRFPLDRMASALLADDAAVSVVRIFKDQGERRLALEMARIMSRFISPEWKHAQLAFIPATAKAKRRRGFDHAELLATELANASGMQLSCLLGRPSSSDQRAFDRRGRIRNMEGCIQVAPANGASMPDEVLVIDDVCTTGATLYAAAGALRQAGVRKVYGLTFAKVIAT